MTRSARRLAVALLATCAIAVAPSAASADLVSTTTSTVTSTTTSTTTFNPVTDWSTLLPSLSPNYDPNDPNLCNSGNPQCVDIVAREMSKRLQPLSDSCSHNALFSLLYYDVTKQVGTAVRTSGYFQDPGFISHEDAVFASYYFNAFDNYAKGDLVDTPMAWQIAFSAGKNHEVQGTGNLLLGMNAHINRDLPFVLEKIGLVAPDGSSRKPDHDQVNNVLYTAYPIAADEGARRFDPSTSANGPGSQETGIQAVIAWREEAWRNAERLVSAPTPGDRAVVVQQIESAANAEAQLIEAAYAYPPGQTSSDRDAYCSVHHNDT